MGRKKVEGIENVGRGSGRVYILGKRRCIVSTPPLLIKLKVKEEVIRETLVDKKECVKSATKTKGSRFACYFPSWAATELSNMVSGIAGYEELTLKPKADLHKCYREKETLEVEARRAKMKLSNKFIFLKQSKSEVDKFCTEEAILADETKGGELCFNIAFTKQTVIHSSDIQRGLGPEQS